MPPTRTRDSQAGASISKQKGEARGRPKRHQNHPGTEPAAPGISKIKSSLRQTRRLLAKEKLAADVRVQTERRLKALETELFQAEIAKKERTLAMRYHKIKFFERQKVMRRINQAKKQLSSTTDRVTKKKLNSTLHDLRIDLNYILHYPKLKKYVSLFPPEVRAGQATSTTSEEDAVKTAQAREETRSWVRSCMEKGELPNEPELHHSSDGARRKDRESGGDLGKHKNSRSKAQDEGGDDIEQDVFFGDDEELS